MGSRIVKKKEYSVFKKPPLPMGKHYNEGHISKLKCFMDDPEYTYLDIALACGMRVNQVGYLIRKIRKEEKTNG